MPSPCVRAGRVCVVYGALPPEMRRTQARLFNDPDSGYNVLVASDAVGMGLNLNIRRIIFHTLSKVENGVRVPISTSQIKQIGGEAASGHKCGVHLYPCSYRWRASPRRHSLFK